MASPGHPSHIQAPPRDPRDLVRDVEEMARVVAALTEALRTVHPCRSEEITEMHPGLAPAPLEWHLVGWGVPRDEVERILAETRPPEPPFEVESPPPPAPAPVIPAPPPPGFEAVAPMSLAFLEAPYAEEPEEDDAAPIAAAPPVALPDPFMDVPLADPFPFLATAATPAPHPSDAVRSRAKGPREPGRRPGESAVSLPGNSLPPAPDPFAVAPLLDPFPFPAPAPAPAPVASPVAAPPRGADAPLPLGAFEGFLHALKARLTRAASPPAPSPGPVKRRAPKPDALAAAAVLDPFPSPAAPAPPVDDPPAERGTPRRLFRRSKAAPRDGGESAESGDKSIAEFLASLEEDDG